MVCLVERIHNALTELNLVSLDINPFSSSQLGCFESNITFNESLLYCEYEEANSVGGELPTEIEQLNLLRFLYLEGARNRQEYFSGTLDLIYGQIPPEISTLSNLVILDLNFNLFDGEVRI